MKTQPALPLALTAVLGLAVFQACTASTSATCGASSCSDAGRVDAGVDAGANPLAAVCMDFNAAVCAFLTRCGAVASESACNALSAPSSTCLFPQKQAVLHGRAAFDASGAAACFDALRNTASCSLPPAGTPGYPGCPAFDTHFVTGLVPDNGTCYQSDECGPHSYCTADGPTGTCPGICVPRNDAGAKVQVSIQCLPGLYDYNGACAPLVRDQGACAASSGATAPQSCVTGDFCDPTSSTCAALRDAGQPCSSGAECNGLSVCDGTVCQPLQPAGASCGFALRRFCKEDLTCLPQYVDGGNSTCVTASPSNPCTQSFDCGAGYRCSGRTAGAFGTCVALLAGGSPCASSPECQTELFCDSTHHCSPQADVGQSCDAVAPGSCKLGSCVSDGAGATSCRPAGCADFGP